jgi:hypothetical protein
MKHGHTFPQLFSNTETPVKDVTIQGESTALAIPIPSLTPLATSSDLPSSKVINIDDLTPIEQKRCLHRISSSARKGNLSYEEKFNKKGE